MKDWRTKFLTPSRLDTFQFYLNGTMYGFQYDEDRFIDDLIGARKETILMQAGTVMHKVLEICGYRELPDYFSYDGWNIKINLDLELDVPHCREVKVITKVGDWELRGKVDYMSTGLIGDYKFTKYIDLEKYMSSWQWKAYLSMTDNYKFNYDVFEFSVDDDKNISINNFERLTIFDYPNMKKEVIDYLDYFMSTLSYLEDKFHNRANQLGIQIEGLNNSERNK